MKNAAENITFTERLKKACSGLTYISETDAAIEPLTTGKIGTTEAEMLKAIGKDEKTQNGNVTFEDFFERLTAARDWHGLVEKKRTKGFVKLEKLLRENLKDIKVFRFGKIRIEIFVIGTDSEGRIAGVKTNAVET